MRLMLDREFVLVRRQRKLSEWQQQVFERELRDGAQCLATAKL